MSVKKFTLPLHDACNSIYQNKKVTGILSNVYYICLVLKDDMSPKALIQMINLEHAASVALPLSKGTLLYFNLKLFKMFCLFKIIQFCVDICTLKLLYDYSIALRRNIFLLYFADRPIHFSCIFVFPLSVEVKRKCNTFLHDHFQTSFVP